MTDVTNIDYFEIFGLDRTSSINHEKLEEIYNNLLTNFHPDKFSDKGKKLVASSIIDRVHMGYQTLICPLKSRLYLLQLAGMDLAQDKNCPKLEYYFLEEIFTITEALVENKTARDMRYIEKEYNKYIEDFDQSLLKKDLEDAAINLLKAKYFYKLKKDF